MGETNFDIKDNREVPGSTKGIMFVCHQGIERSRRASQLLEDEGYAAETFSGGMHKMKGLTVEEIRRQIPNGIDLVLIYDHRVGNGNKPSEQQVAIDECEALLRKAGINYREMTTTQLKIFLSGLGVQNIGWKFNAP